MVMTTAPKIATLDTEPSRQVQRLHELFAGAESLHGTYVRGLRLVGDKMEMNDDAGNGARTIPEPPTIDLWQITSMATGLSG